MAINSGHSGSHECKSWSELGKKGAEHPEPKVECPNCEQRIDYEDQHLHEGDSPHVVPFFTCQPAQPEPTTPVGNEDCQKAKAEGPWLAEVLKPAAPEREMPEAVDKACDLLEWGGNISAAAALRAAWRSQPVAVGISEELENVLMFSSLRARILKDSHQGDSVALGEQMIAAIAAVRERYGRKG